MREENENFLPFDIRKQLILNIDTIVSHSISLTNASKGKKMKLNVDVHNKKWKSKKTIKDKDMYNNIKVCNNKNYIKPGKSNNKLKEEELLSQRKENIKGYINHIIRYKRNNKLMLVDIEDNIMHNKFDVDVGKNKIIGLDMKWNSSASAVNRNKNILGNSFTQRKVNIVSKTIDLDNNNKFNNEIINTSSLCSCKGVQSSDVVSISSSNDNNTNKQLNINDNTNCFLEKYYFNHNNKYIAPLNLYPLKTINTKTSNNQKQQQHILNIKLPNKPKTFEQIIISDTNTNNNNNNTSKNIITTENLISQNTLTKIYNNNYIQTPKYKNTSSLRIIKTLERNYLLTQLNESLFRVLKHSSSHKVYDSLSEEEIDNIEPKHLYLIFPDSIFIQLWQFLLSLLSLCIIFILPIDLAFIPNINTYTLLFNIIISLIHFIDMFLHFFVPYIPNIEHEIYETNKLQIAIHYIKGWFLYDTLSSLPINLVYELYTHHNNYKHHRSLFELFKLLPLLKTLKLLFISNYPSITYHISSLSFLMNNLSKQTRMIIFFILFLLFNHIFACIFAFIGKLSYPNWLTHINCYNKPNIDIYIAGMYYNITTIFTCGFGDIISITLIETLYTMLLQSIGIFLYSYMVSSMMTIIKKDESELALERKLLVLEAINMDYKLSKSLYTKLKRVLTYDYIVNKEKKIKFIKEFPEHIKNALVCCMFSNVVKFKFFKNTNFDFVSKVVLNMKAVRFTMGDVVVKRKCYFEEMFFVDRGILSLERDYLNRCVKIAEIRKGEHFGEVNMLLNKKSKFDVVVKSKVCECYLLNKDILIKVVEKYEDVFSRKERKATVNYFLFEKKWRKRKREIDKEELLRNVNEGSNNNNKKQLLKRFTKNYLNEPYEQDIIDEIEEDESVMLSPIDGVNKKSTKGLSTYKIKVDKVKCEPKTPTRNLSHLNVIQPLSNILSPKIKRSCILPGTPQQHNINIVNNNSNNSSIIVNNNKRRNSHSVENNNNPNNDINPYNNKKKFSTGVIRLNINKPLSSQSLTDKVKQGTILMKQTIHLGSMNMSQPKIFYSNLFDRLKLSDQLHKINSIYTLLKTNNT